MFHLALHFIGSHKPQLLFAAGGLGAAGATIANHVHLHDLATIAGSLATIFTVLAAALSTAGRKQSRANRRRKPRRNSAANQPTKQP